MTTTPSALVEESLDTPRSGARRTAEAVSGRMAWRRETARLSRWLHIYGSMISFALVLFFSATGITLNHPEWFAGQARLTDRSGDMYTTWLSGTGDDVAKLEIVEFLRTAHGITGAVTDFRVDDIEASVAFKGPGYSADVFIDRATGHYELTESRLGLVAVMNDLHKGRDVGGVWKAVIDLSAGLLLFVSLSGLLLLYFLKKHRLAGIMLLGAGGMASYLVYLIWVP